MFGWYRISCLWMITIYTIIYPSLCTQTVDLITSEPISRHTLYLNNTYFECKTNAYILDGLASCWAQAPTHHPLRGPPQENQGGLKNNNFKWKEVLKGHQEYTPVPTHKRFKSTQHQLLIHGIWLCKIKYTCRLVDMNAYMIPVHQLIYIYKLNGAKGDVLAWTTSFMRII